MKNYLKINLNNLRQEGLKEILDTMEYVFQKEGVDFYYLIGAMARDIWSEQRNIITRHTRDIDFAVMISSVDQFEKVKQQLIQEYQFTSVTGNEFALQSPTGITIDLLPFGKIEVMDGVIVQGVGLQQIKVNGFKEIAESGIAEVQSEEHSFNIATLPAIILLKCISYDDRPEKRQKDPDDIMKILQTYFDIATDVFYDKHYDLLDRIDEGRDIIAARVVGRELRNILSQNMELKNRITKILKQHINTINGNAFTEIMARTSGQTVERAIILLNEILLGIKDPSKIAQQ